LSSSAVMRCGEPSCNFINRNFSKKSTTLSERESSKKSF
jgi:hypothetical protein